MPLPMTAKQVSEVFGVDPDCVGCRSRGWQVDPDGRLRCCARDPGMNVFDVEAMQRPNFDGLEIDEGDTISRPWLRAK